MMRIVDHLQYQSQAWVECPTQSPDEIEFVVELYLMILWIAVGSHFRLCDQSKNDPFLREQHCRGGSVFESVESWACG